jgi:RNA polymerase sigma factor (sigma-70 family)
MGDELTERRILELYRDPATRNHGFNMLVHEYQQPVYWLLRRMVFDHDDANDLTQDTFVKIWQHLGNFREESKLFTWIYRIASNEALTFLKQRKKRWSVSLDHAESKSLVHIKDDNYFKGDEIQKKLHSAIQQLPPQQRLIFNMRYFDDVKYEEMSKILKLTQGALKASFHHAVKKIEKIVTAD